MTKSPRQEFFSLMALVRFWESVNITETCWQWNKNLKRKGYGYILIDGINFRAHRYSLLIHGIEIPNDKVVDHICRNRACVNPDHLRIVSNEENVLFNSNSVTAKHKVKTHCLRGHEFTKENTRVIKGKNRRCKECEKIHWKNHDLKYRRKNSCKILGN